MTAIAKVSLISLYLFGGYPVGLDITRPDFKTLAAMRHETEQAVEAVYNRMMGFDPKLFEVKDD